VSFAPTRRSRLLWTAVALAVALTVASRLLDSWMKTETGLVRTIAPLAAGEGEAGSGPSASRPGDGGRLARGIGLEFLDEEPGMPRRMFRAEWDGVWYVPDGGAIDIHAGADDWVVVRIDGAIVIERKTGTGSTTAHRTLVLEPGFHALNVLYGQERGRASLNVRWAPSGRAARAFDPEYLFPGAPDPQAFAINQRLRWLRRATVGLWMAVALGLLAPLAARRVRSLANSPSGRRRLAAGLVFLLALAAYFANALHFEPLVFNRRQNVIFSADTATTIASMHELTFREHIRQHPLFSIVTSSLVKAVRALSPLGTNRSILAVVALIAALNCTLAYLIVRRVRSGSTAAWLAAAYGALFCNLALFSIPETYSLATLGVLLYLWYATGLTSGVTMRQVVVLGMLSGAAALLNPPLLSLVVVALVLIAWHAPPQRGLALGALNLTVTAACFVAVNALIYGTQFYLNYATDNERYGRVEHLASVDAIGLVLAGFYLYSAVSPRRQLTHHLTLGDASGYLDSAAGAALLVVYVGLTLMALARALRSRDPVILGVLFWLAPMTGFYVYFNPPGVMLYAVQVLPALLLIWAHALAGIETRPRTRLALAVFTVLLMLRNIPAVYAPVEIASR
jgi:hypothetical protein